jgi:hypothetical protein
MAAPPARFQYAIRAPQPAAPAAAPAPAVAVAVPAGAAVVTPATRVTTTVRSTVASPTPSPSAAPGSKPQVPAVGLLPTTTPSPARLTASSLTSPAPATTTTTTSSVAPAPVELKLDLKLQLLIAGSEPQRRALMSVLFPEVHAAHLANLKSAGISRCKRHLMYGGRVVRVEMYEAVTTEKQRTAGMCPHIHF